MVYRKEATGVVCAVTAAMFLSACWNADKWGSQRSVFTDDAVKREITKVDYAPTQTWFALSPFNGSGSEFSFSGNTFFQKGKALTGTLLIETVKLLKESDWNYYRRPEKQGPKIISAPNAASLDAAPLPEPEALLFVKGLTKMALLGERYEYDESNLRPWQDYKLKIYETSKGRFVLEFENKTESRIRDKTMEEFEERLKELNLKHIRDPRRLNEEIEKLRLEYGIDVRKFQ